MYHTILKYVDNKYIVLHSVIYWQEFYYYKLIIAVKGTMVDKVCKEKIRVVRVK